MGLPYGLQLAHGWTKLSLLKTLIAVILLVPFIIYMTAHYGATGAAIAWLILNLSMFIFEIPIMHRRLLCQEKWRWYWNDVGFPIAIVIVIAGLGRLFISGSMPQFMMVSYLIIISVLTFTITAIATPITRSWLFEQLLKIKYMHGAK